MTYTFSPQASDYISVHVSFLNPDGFASVISGENLHAIRLPALEIDGELVAGNFAQIDNVPFFCEGLHLHDIVEFDDTGEVTSIIKPSGFQTARVLFQGMDEAEQISTIEQVKTDELKFERGLNIWVLTSTNGEALERALAKLTDSGADYEYSGAWENR